MSEPPDEEREQRRHFRRRVLLTGKLVHGEPPLTLDCTVSNLSSGGACVRLEAGAMLGEPLYLILVSQALAFRSRVVWRRANQTGLAFEQYYDLREPDEDLPKLVRQIWIEQQGR